MERRPKIKPKQKEVAILEIKRIQTLDEN